MLRAIIASRLFKSSKIAGFGGKWAVSAQCSVLPPKIVTKPIAPASSTTGIGDSNFDATTNHEDNSWRLLADDKESLERALDAYTKFCDGLLEGLEDMEIEPPTFVEFYNFCNRHISNEPVTTTLRTCVSSVGKAKLLGATSNVVQQKRLNHDEIGEDDNSRKLGFMQDVHGIVKAVVRVGDHKEGTRHVMLGHGYDLGTSVDVGFVLELDLMLPMFRMEILNTLRFNHRTLPHNDYVNQKILLMKNLSSSLEDIRLERNLLESEETLANFIRVHVANIEVLPTRPTVVIVIYGSHADGLLELESRNACPLYYKIVFYGLQGETRRLKTFFRPVSIFNPCSIYQPSLLYRFIKYNSGAMGTVKYLRRSGPLKLFFSEDPREGEVKTGGGWVKTGSSENPPTAVAGPGRAGPSPSSISAGRERNDALAAVKTLAQTSPAPSRPIEPVVEKAAPAAPEKPA